MQPLDPSDRRPVLIAGPTASGKSALALALAEALDGVVINADALQVYDGWRVLTARPSPEEEARAPHRLYGHVPVTAGHSTGAWLREGRAALEAARGAGLRPLIVGGSGLLFAALTEGLAEIPATPPEIRARGEARLAAEGLPALAAELTARDPRTAAGLDLANPRRVQRAWEVLEATGRPLSEWQADAAPPTLPPGAFRALRLDPPRDRLAERIARRFDLMLAGGALEEARAALDWIDPAPQALAPLGAAELMAHLRGALSLEEARARAVAATRRYAKRQRTWARNRMADWPTFGSTEAALAALLPS
ncbi:MAG: tRNA (adenosine(37)-N6)-dimethylallyltransferase MiaA [Pseudomonadota bacterium]